MTEEGGWATSLYRDMRAFYCAKDVVSMAVSLTIGFATRDVICCIVHQMIVPSLQFAARAARLHAVHVRMLDAAKANRLAPVVDALGNLCYAVFVWAILLIASFLLLEYFLARVVLRTSAVKNDCVAPDRHRPAAENFRALKTVQSRR